MKRGWGRVKEERGGERKRRKEGKGKQRREGSPHRSNEYIKQENG